MPFCQQESELRTDLPGAGRGSDSSLCPTFLTLPPPYSGMGGFQQNSSFCEETLVRQTQTISSKKKAVLPAGSA